MDPITRNTRRPRRATAALAAVLGAALALPGAAGAQGPATEGVGHLLVADPAATSIHVYSLPDLVLTGQLDDTLFGVHNGALVLEDGRVIYSDDLHDEVRAIRIDDAGLPTIDARVGVTNGDRLVWSSIDPDARYYVAASQIVAPEPEAGASPAPEPGLVDQVLNIVDLATWTNTVVPFPMDADEEIIGMLSGDPLTLTVSTGGRVSTYALDALLAGDVTPLGSLPIELGSHGSVTDAARGRVAVVTIPGFEVVDVSGGAPVHVGLIPWDVDGISGGRNARPRLGMDGDHIHGVLTSPVAAPEAWATAQVSAHIADLTDLTAHRVALGTGRWAGRTGISTPYALYAGYDGTSAQAVLFDVDPASATFGTVVASIPLDPPTKASVPGTATTGTEGYLTAITADGALGFVVHGGDGRISVIDTATRTIVGRIDTPTPLTGAGFAVAVQTGVTPVDLFAR
ncbi:MAG: hypothetical protein KF809_10285 [Chloroflexi bacterium]|nr:hypothetical protein [Chloroflexota bacterium]